MTTSNAKQKKPNFESKLKHILKKFFKMVLALFALIIVIAIVATGYYSGFRTRTRAININGAIRKYRIHLPSGYSKDKSYPLFIVLHGLGDNPRFMEAYTGFSREVDEKGFIAVYPYGSSLPFGLFRSWNAGFCCGPAIARHVDDVSFINQLTDELFANYSVDASKVFIVGFSNGAMMANRIATETPEKYAGIAIVSGAVGARFDRFPEFKLPAPAKALDVIMFHGTADTAVPPYGGELGYGGSFATLAESATFWTEAMGCSETGNGLFEGCRDSKRVKVVVLEGKKHVWSGGIWDAIVSKGKKGLNTTEEIYRFLVGS